MRRAWYLCAAAAVLLAANLAASAQNFKVWQLDPDHSDAHFEVVHLGITHIQGDFPKLSGTVTIDDQDITKSTVDVTIDVKSIYTRVPARDEDLRGADFFDVAKYPTMTFRSTKFVKTGPGTLKMTGNMTLHGTTREVTFDVSGPSAPVMFMGEWHRGARGTATILRRQFGVSGDYPTVTDEVQVTLDVDVIPKK